jgi:hypothetical protein
LTIPSLRVPAHEATEMPTVATTANGCILLEIVLARFSMLAGFAAE